MIILFFVVVRLFTTVAPLWSGSPAERLSGCSAFRCGCVFFTESPVHCVCGRTEEAQQKATFFVDRTHGKGRGSGGKMQNCIACDG